ncbi:MAG: HAD family hydrolase [bacterium]
MHRPDRKEIFHDIETVIFDMDGVITSEAEYWNAADLTVLELFYSKQFLGLENETLQTALHKPGAPITLERFVSPRFIAMLKTSGINTNWDLTYFSAALYLIEFLAEIKPHDKVQALFESPFNINTLHDLGKLIDKKRKLLEPIDNLNAYFVQFRKKRLAEKPLRNENPADHEPLAERLVEDINAWRYERTGFHSPVFERSGPFWDICTTLFQERYLGDSLYLKEHDARLSDIPKDGMIQDERPVIPGAKVISTLALLKEAGMRLGVATGRPFDEIMIPLKRWGVFHFFDKGSIATYREIAEAEQYLCGKGIICSIAKPHPYVYLRAIFPDKSVGELLDMKMPLPKKTGGRILVVGDSMSDLIAARTLGALAAVVLTGVKSLEAVDQMRALDPDFILDDISQFEGLF